MRLSPRRLLTRVRVEAAARLLRETGERLDAIAQACGFYDQAQFSRQFKSATGVTPGKYRG
ncbi:MAG: helix-turn-helix domain-containing protein [Tepidisphaeraceae bacterium]